MQVTEECLLKGIEAVKPGRRSATSARRSRPTPPRTASAWSATTAATASARFPHRAADPPLLRRPPPTTVIEEGMIFTIEPMLTEGSWGMKHWNDGWTVVTADGTPLRPVRAHNRPSPATVPSNHPQPSPDDSVGMPARVPGGAARGETPTTLRGRSASPPPGPVHSFRRACRRRGRGSGVASTTPHRVYGPRRRPRPGRRQGEPMPVRHPGDAETREPKARPPAGDLGFGRF